MAVFTSAAHIGAAFFKGEAKYQDLGTEYLNSYFQHQLCHLIGHSFALAVVHASASTFCASMPMWFKILASSLTNSILISRWLFSMTFAASATLMDGTGCVPAVLTEA